jgi:cephalosporin hydroxylase
MWEDYFPNANIVGVDNEVRQEYEADRVKIFLADQSQPSQLNRVIELTTTEYDLILDDGSHLCPHQYISWATLFKYVKPGGYYIIEDLHCNFFPKWPDWRDNNVMITPLEAVQSLQEGEFRYQYISDEDAAYIQEHTDSVIIFDRTGEYDSITCIIRKK